jgi:hypothetical protein
MSGKRQHFIPCFLQNGFASHINGEQIFTWVYRKGQNPFNSNIVKVGVEGYFYSQEGDNQVDDIITKAENSFDTLIQTLRNSKEEEIIDSKKIAEMITHFEIRTRNIRESFTNTNRYIHEATIQILNDKYIFESYLDKLIPQLIQEQARKALHQRRLPESYLKKIINHLNSNIEIMKKEASDAFPSIVNQMEMNLPTTLKNISKDAHIKALRQDISPQAKIEKYQKLQFSLLPSTSINIPLGDSVIIFQVDGEREFKPFCMANDSLKAIYMPLSSGLILVGNAVDNTLDLSRLPMIIAQCSLEHFISNSNENTNSILQNHIGENAFILPTKEIDVLLMKLITEQIFS